MSAEGDVRLLALPVELKNTQSFVSNQAKIIYKQIWSLVCVHITMVEMGQGIVRVAEGEGMA